MIATILLALDSGSPKVAKFGEELRAIMPATAAGWQADPATEGSNLIALATEHLSLQTCSYF